VARSFLAEKAMRENAEKELKAYLKILEAKLG
jgi:hypothetical protein